MAETQPTTNGDNTIHHSDSETLYLIRLSQSHESFRLAELESLAAYLNINLKIHDYSRTSPFCTVSFPDPGLATSSIPTQRIAKSLISRSILSKSIYQLYATASTYPSLHGTIQSLPPSTWSGLENVSFKFNVDAYRGKRSMKEQRAIVEQFRYLPFKGKIRMNGAEEHFMVFEEWEGLTAEECALLRQGSGEKGVNVGGHEEEVAAVKTEGGSTGDVLQRRPSRLFFGRFIGTSQRELADKHDLKKRPYISTTSMDAELALVTALLAHAGPGRLMLDPFVGTGGFMVAAGELGAVTLGSDIDGRSFRGKGAGLEKGVLANFRKYGIIERFGDCVTADLTNTPFRLPRARSKEEGGSHGKDTGVARWLDGIICDPPYGVREGLKVLGRRHHDGPSENGRTLHAGPYFVDGVPSHLLPGFIAPKRPYSFDKMLGDILDFAARTLVDGGRLAFWMPCANEAEEDFGIPRHPFMELKHLCVQSFNKWSRRLLIYQRVAGEMLEGDSLADGVETLSLSSANGSGHHADDLNQFRRMYFKGFNHIGTSTPKNENG